MSLEKLEWFPIYVDRLLSSPAWSEMKDYQRGWYIQLLLRSTRSERLGYLPLDGSLWRVAGAHSKAMWDNHKAAVMACFKIRTDDGRDWIYNDRLLNVMEEQSVKYRKNPKSPPKSKTENRDIESCFLEKRDSSVSKCGLHPESGRTPWGTCWACYQEKYQA